MVNKRIFIAINLPLDIKKEIERAKEKIQNSFPEEVRGELIKWVEKENLHITLLFIGSVEEEKLGLINQIVKDIMGRGKVFSLKLKKICYGPPRKIPPRLIWLELKENTELLKFAQELKKEMLSAGILKGNEDRSFSPHITLGRIKVWQWKKIEPEERPDIEEEIELELNVNSIEIMESKLKRTGAKYERLETYNL